MRVSRTRGREGESFASPGEQRERIRLACERDKLELVETFEELDVSGGTPLADREGLRTAVEQIERGEAEIVMVAYFDRLVRSLRVQEEVVTRVEAAGGRVVALDIGDVTGDTAGQWLQGTMIGAVAEYMRRSVGERSRAAQERAVERGALPWPSIPPGYERGEDGILIPDHNAPVVKRAFEMRARGETIAVIRTFLQANGTDRSYHGVSTMLASPLYLGEIHFGKLTNLEAHEALISRDLWQVVQGMKVSRGRKAKSERLLARLGILRCGTCGARMVVGTSHKGKYGVYRCPPTGDCPKRMAISAEIAEGVVIEAVREALAGQEGRASATSDAQEAEARALRAQEDLDSAIRAFTGLEDEPTARDRLRELREARDAARGEADQLCNLHSALTITVGADWARLTLAERRALIQAVVERVEVGEGRGPGRITVSLFGE